MNEEEDMLLFYGHTRSKNKINKSCLSQWYPCEFTHGGITYTSTEQYMMSEKARLFKDDRTDKLILETNSPKTAKELGREVRNFNPVTWDWFRQDIVQFGNYLKFSQNPELKEFLLSTEDKILVEASPYDKIWGIGLRMDHPDAKIRGKWEGLNLLGVALMHTRILLKKEAEQNNGI